MNYVTRRTRAEFERLKLRAIELHGDGQTCPQIAKVVGVSRSRVRVWIANAGLSINTNAHRFTDDEIALIKAHWQRIPAREVAAMMPRHGVGSIRHKACRLGVAGKRDADKKPARWKEVLLARLAAGHSQNEIASELGVTREFIRRQMRYLHLHASGMSDHCRRRVAERTRKQLEKAGVKSLVQIRFLAFRKFAQAHGWPEDLRPRAVQILEALAANPLLSREQIAAEIGVPWRGSRKSLVSNDPEGSYLAHLKARGLVIRSPKVPTGRIGKRKRCGTGVHYYALSPEAREIKQRFLERNQNGERSITDGNECSPAGGTPANR